MGTLLAGAAGIDRTQQKRRMGVILAGCAAIAAVGNEPQPLLVIFDLASDTGVNLHPHAVANQ